ncbi:hypothetical protein [Plasmodium yoelii yoelii]|uniref:Fam-d protein n=3 Tax=Plasmodium yoelii TaxID=5861 RepID=A0AAF0B018_PLAYO|nr:hypothetical protein [Plasmodium yoelii yoelii]WBY57312.1 fam-d protein [Plasmodium yoelii yoelii]
MNIILSFFILVISGNVKGASFRDANHNIPEPIAYISLAKPTAVFAYDKKKHIKYLDLINSILSEQSTNKKYKFAGGNYHWIIIDINISIDNSSLLLKHFFSENKIEAFKLGTRHFISYIEERIKFLISRYIYKYDFEKNYATDLINLAEDLKPPTSNRFIYEFINNLIRFKKMPPDIKLKEMSNEVSELLLQNSSIKIQGYCIKIMKYKNPIYIKNDFSFYFNIAINKYKSNVTYNFEFPKSEIAELCPKSEHFELDSKSEFFELDSKSEFFELDSKSEIFELDPKPLRKA